MDTTTYTAVMMTVGAVILMNVLFLLVVMRAVARDREKLIEMGEAQAEAARPLTFDPEGLRRAPIGTLAILLLFLMAILGLWSSVFWLLLQRS
jgi:hypothetical protein